MPTSLTDPPDLDQLEVSIFGPGKGESIVVHIGDGRWIIVDSCVETRSRLNPKPIPALDYLEGLGVDLDTDVVMVVATHAHDDHFKGIARIFDRCESSIFVCGDALSGEEFRALIDADGEFNDGLRVSAYKEYRTVFATARARRVSQRAQRSLLVRAIEGRPLHVASDTSAIPGLRVLALSPSDEAVTRATTAFRSVVPTYGSNRHIPPVDPNEIGIALWIDSGTRAVLLGADLTVGPSGCGWEAVLASFDPPARKASLFKIPHHGSPNAHHDGVWSRLLSDRCVALLAPFRGSKSPRPSPDDERRIVALTDLSFGTAPTKTPTLSAQTKRARLQLGTIARNVRDPWGTAGHVRARSSTMDDSWTIDLFGPAYQLPSEAARS